MMYFLQTQGGEKSYAKKTTAEKRDFFESYYTELCIKKGTISKQVVRKACSEVATESLKYDWLSKKEMEDKWGVARAAARIAALPADMTRPDPITGLNDEDNKEWKIYRNVGSKASVAVDSVEATVEADLDADGATEAASNILDMQNCLSLGSSASSGSSPGVAPAAPALAKKIKLEPREDPPKVFTKTIESLQQKPQVIVQAMNAKILQMKKMHQETLEMKFASELNTAIGEALKVAAALYKKVEAVHTKGEKDLAVLTALGGKLDSFYKDVQEIEETERRMKPPAAKKQRA